MFMSEDWETFVYTMLERIEILLETQTKELWAKKLLLVLVSNFALDISMCKEYGWSCS
jgi:hypothetical protein